MRPQPFLPILIWFFFLTPVHRSHGQDPDSWIEGLETHGRDSIFQERKRELKNCQKVRDTLCLARWAKTVAVHHFTLLNQYEEAIKIGHFALRWAEKGGDPDLQGACLNNLGIFYMNLGKWEKAAEAYKESLEISRRLEDSISLGKGLHNLGNLYLGREKYSQADSSFNQAQSINRAMGRWASVEKNLLSLGIVAAKQNEWRKARSYYFQGIEAHKKSREDKGLNLIYTHLANTYNETYQPDSALCCLQQALEEVKKRELFEDELFLMYSIGNWYFNRDEYSKAIEIWETALDSLDGQKLNISVYLKGGLAMAYKHQEKYETSRDFYQKAIADARHWKVDREVATYQLSLANLERREGKYQEAKRLLRNILDQDWMEEDLYRKTKAETDLGLIYMDEKQFDKAEPLFQKGIEASISFNLWEDLIAIYHGLGKIAEERGDIQALQEYLGEKSRWKDSLRERQYSKELAKVRGSYENELQQKEIAQLEERQGLLSDSLAKSKRSQQLMILILVLSFLTIGIVSYLGITLRRQSLQIENQRQRLEELNQGKDRMFAIIAHDLASPISNFEDLNRLFSYYLKNDKKQDLFQLSEEVAVQSRQLRRLLDNLLQWALQQLGTYRPIKDKAELHSLIREQVDLFSGRMEEKNISLILDAPPSLNWEGDIKGLRIAMANLISNAVKFSENANLRILLGEQEGRLLFLVEDQGVGMEAEILEAIRQGKNLTSTPGSEGERGAGFGLQFVWQWLKQVQGRLIAESSPGRGSCIGFSLSLS